MTTKTKIVPLYKENKIFKNATVNSKTLEKKNIIIFDDGEFFIRVRNKFIEAKIAFAKMQDQEKD